MTRTTLTFLGAAGQVTGSKYLVTVDPGAGEPRRILVDSGMFQGQKRLRELNWSDFPVPPASISDILITHAHMDHTGYLPALVKQGFHGRIHCTPATVELTGIVLRDAGYLQERDAEHAQEHGYSKHHPALALYGVADVDRTLPLLSPIAYDTDLDLGDGLVARFTRAGHILGSASIHLSTPDGSILFSGDLGRPDHPILRSRETPAGAGIVLMESTYGNRPHPTPTNLPHEQVADAIRRTVQRGGSVLIPAFAVDRTEIVLAAISQMQHHGRIPTVPVYVDSPMALAALRVYRDPRYRGELRDDVDVERFIDLPNLSEVTTTEESIRLNAPRVPSIIISSSGMATGGRVLHHLEHLLPDHRNTVILTGFQAAGTRGRALQEGASQLKMHGRYVSVRAEVVSDDEFSVHADGDELIAWLAALAPAPSTVFLVHGEQGSSTALRDRVHSELGLTAVVPSLGETVRITPTAGVSGAPEQPTTTPAPSGTTTPQPPQDSSTPTPAAPATAPATAPASTPAWLPSGVEGIQTDLRLDPDASDTAHLVLRGTVTLQLHPPVG